ncbi:GNAT family N-acetyltransferase [Roseivirga pacifica]|uniref:GNAT family N-acetyltransferase n=1 Tax=Roseivirga pacifica TaxID=1267423 RepID=UPI00227CE15F|nr:GNAT family N-acetyltransferase [Roseivirga pacifica]
MQTPEPRIKPIPHEETWQIRHNVMWPDKPFDYVKLPNDELGKHYGLFVGDKMVAIISLFIEGRSAQFRKFATIISEQGKGYGAKLLAHIMQEATHLNIDVVWCNARVDKTEFYKKFGLQPTDQTFRKGGIDYVIMEKRL